MVDRFKSIINIGDYVKYWHYCEGKPTPEIGQIVDINVRMVKISRREYSGTQFSYRTPSGIARMTLEEAMLWKMEY